MRPIPPELRKELEADKFYNRCCITGLSNKEVKIDWHHNFQFAGRQVNEKWCILPLFQSLHKEMSREIKERLNWIMYNRASDETLEKYSKAVDLKWERNRLNIKFGVLTFISK